MILLVESFIQQIKFGKEYHGYIRLNGKEFRYLAKLDEKLSEPAAKKFNIEFHLFNSRWEGLNLEERIERMLKSRIAEDIIEFYAKLEELKLNDNGLLGGIVGSKEYPTHYSEIEGRISKSEKYGLKVDPNAFISAKEIEMFLDRYQ